MDVESVAGRWTGSRRRGAALIFTGMIAGLAMVLAAPAQGAPYTATAWGLNTSGQLGDGTTTGPEKCAPEETPCGTTPVGVSGLSGVTAVSGGATHSLALLSSGTVMAWGNNGNGQLGNGTTASSDVPVAVCAGAPQTSCATGPYLSGVVAVSGGFSHSLALLSNGTVMAWGNNVAGQLGNGTTESSDVPVPVCAAGTEKPEEPSGTWCPTGPYLSGVVAVSAGSNHNLALLSNGTVMAWGGDFHGQLGNGTNESSTVPVPVSGLSGVVAIAAGPSSEFSLALLSNGSVMAWGENAFGQLGNGTTTNSNVVVAVSGLSEVKAISAGASHSLAQLSNGSVKAWGVNEKGQLGDGTNAGPEACGLPPSPCSKTPVAVSGLRGVSVISAGSQHSLALLSSGSVMAWGANGFGQLGDGTSLGPEPCGPSSCSTKPVEVLYPGVPVGIAAGGSHSLAFGPPPPPPTPLPEFGRCVKAKEHKGDFKYKGCLVPAEGPTGAYEWLPGPGSEPKFKGEAGTAVFETVAKERVSCGAAIVEGEYTSAKAATLTITIKGCTNINTGLSCATEPKEKGEIVSKTLEGEVGFIKNGEKPVVGLDLRPKSPNKELFSFACAEPPPSTAEPEQWIVEGSVIGRITPIDAMRSEFALRYTASKGKQSPERFEGGLKDTLGSKIFIKPDGIPPLEEPPAIQTGLTLRGEKATFPIENQEYEPGHTEKIEIKAKP